MNAVVITSNSLRHKYFVETIAKDFNVVGIISEPKKNYYTKVKNESSVVEEHFENLAVYEKSFFEDASFPSHVDIQELSKEDINSEELVSWVKEKNPDVIFLFGTAILKDIWLDNFQNKIINLHLGLSPYYRGAATLFWPIYNNDLEYLGVTVHIAAKKVDSGDILGRLKPRLEGGDNYYTINYKAIKQGIEYVPNIVNRYLNNEVSLTKQDLSLSKVYKKADFTEDKLLSAFNTINSESFQSKLVNSMEWSE